MANPRLIENDFGNVFFNDKAADNYLLDDKDTILDKEWVESAFLCKGTDLDSPDNVNRFFSTAELKFTDTSLGGNIGINSRPQYTRYADIRSRSRRLDRDDVTVMGVSGGYGMGQYYSESIDDNSQTLFLEFGVREFNSLISFFSRSIDYPTSVIANTGRSPIAYEAGNIFGAAAMFVAFPLASIAIYGVKFISSMLSNNDNFSYYYIKPTMHTYWGTVNTIVTAFATELGILIPEFMDSGKGADNIGIPVKLNQTDLDYMRQLMPDIITNNNYIDVFAIANKAQALANKQILMEKRLYDEGKLSNTDFKGYVKTPLTDHENSSPGEGFSNLLNEIFSFNKLPNEFSKAKDIVSYEDYLNDFKNKDTAAYTKKKEVVETDIKTATNISARENKESYESKLSDADSDGFVSTGVPKTDVEKDPSFFEGLTANIDAAVRGGGQYAVFKVDYVGTVSESFSNSVTDIGTGSAIRSVTQKGKSVEFSLAGGNITSGMGDALGYIKDFAMGTLDGLTFGLSNVIPTLLGGGYIDIPKMWDDSSVSLPKVTYNMSLRAPYGNTISRLQNVYIPLAMLLAGVLPLSIGKAGYTSPFLCSSFLKGIQRIKLGMITDLSITRGTSNLAYDKQWKALGIDVSFSITDFSNIMTAPVNSGLFGSFKLAFDDGSLFSNYISTLAARDLMVTKYSVPKAKIKLSRALFSTNALTSPAFWGIRAGNVLEGALGSVVSDTSLNLLHANR